jgi:hypothetical protein
MVIFDYLHHALFNTISVQTWPLDNSDPVLCIQLKTPSYLFPHKGVNHKLIISRTTEIKMVYMHTTSQGPFYFWSNFYAYKYKQPGTCSYLYALPIYLFPILFWLHFSFGKKQGTHKCWGMMPSQVASFSVYWKGWNYNSDLIIIATRCGGAWCLSCRSTMDLLKLVDLYYDQQ